MVEKETNESKVGRDCKGQLEERDKEKDLPFPDRAPKVGPDVGHIVDMEKPVPSTLFSIAA